MSRIRSIKPEFFTSETVARAPLGARLLFIGLWTHCDDAGRCRDNPAVLKGALFAMDEGVQAGDIDTWLGHLHALGLVRRYVIEGKRYLSVTNWLEHQKISHAGKSRLPAPSDLPQENSGDPPEDSVKAPEGLRPDLGSRIRDLGKPPLPPTNGARVHLTKPDPARLTPSECERTFNQFWEAYPRRVGKRAARSAWDRATRFAAPEKILASLTAALPELRKKDPQYIPHPTTWLNQGRWEDETTAGATSAPTARCFTCRKDVAKGGGCTQGEANLEYCDRKDWVTHGQVHRVPHVDSA